MCTKLRTSGIILILIYSATFLSGCWNYREVNTIAIVMAAAIDRDVNSNEYILTVEIVRVAGGRINSELGRKIYESKGKTIFDAARNLIIETGRRAYWSHSKVIIINSNIAEEDISRVLDWFYRDSELRRDVKVLIFRGDKAGDVLKSNPKMDDTTGYNLFETFRNQKGVNKYPDKELGEVVGKLSQSENAIIVPTVELIYEEDKPKNSIQGSTILKGTKIIGYLNPEETKDVLTISGNLKKGIFPVEDIMGTGEDVTMELYGSKNKTEVNYQDDKVSIIVNIKLEVGIAEITGNLDFTKDEVRKKIDDDVERVLKERLEHTINKAQKEFQCDIFEFGTKMQIQNPKEWKKNKENWNELFSTASVKVNVSIHIRGSATASKPVKGS